MTLNHKVVRSFNPVGQGAFYSETHKILDKEYIVVYDCGSNNKDVLKEEINSSFLDNSKIYAVFISHMHYDHINGVEYLLKNYNVKNIFLPLLSKKQKLFELIYLAKKNIDSKNIVNFIIDPKKYISKISSDVNIISIHPVGIDNYNDENQELSFNNLPNDIYGQAEIAISNKLDWVFIPCNFRGDTRKQKIIEKIQLHIPNIFNKNGSINFNYLKNNFKKIKDNLSKYYKSIKGSLNTNSTVLYSGPLKSNYHKKSFDIRNFKSCYCKRYDSKCGCLYTGDYDTKGPQKYNYIDKTYKKIEDKIGTVQIPHHGSKYNFNPRLIKRPNINSVVSCGLTNQYRHPHKVIFTELFNKNSNIFIVNETKNTQFIEYISNF